MLTGFQAWSPHLHHGNCRVNFWREWNVNLVFITINPTSWRKKYEMQTQLIFTVYIEFFNYSKKYEMQTELIFVAYIEFFNLIIDKTISIIFYAIAYPTLMPSSMSVGATWSPKSTTNFANCFTFIIYFASSVSAFIILVHRATCEKTNTILQTFPLSLWCFVSQRHSQI